eukprot:TRINITY_DN60178_c0_g2_i1.p1 TRINITY_DN60178_c0_g2~~TRINITY_DN60178_c0_g2_i1.p1  ORF type:complete len:141 (-),score=74.37 TRINITY_DN60178_c0_g2_i1:51-473(-)
MQQHNVPLTVDGYNALISVYAKSGQKRRALQMYERMLDEGVKPSMRTLGILSYHLSSRQHAQHMITLLKRMQEQQLRLDPSSLAAVCRGVGADEFRQVVTMYRLLNDMTQPEACNALLVAYRSVGDTEGERALLEEMNKQ